MSHLIFRPIDRSKHTALISLIEKIQNLFIFAPHLPHEIIEQVLIEREESKCSTIMIVNSLNEMNLTTNSDVQYGSKLKQDTDSIHVK